MAGSWYIFLTLLLCCVSVGFADTLPTESDVTQGNLLKLARANNDLALKIFHHLAEGSRENYFFSPLSLSILFGMLYYGAKGGTAQELRNTIGYERDGLQDELIHRTFQQYLTEILPSHDPTAYTLNSANAILLDNHLNLVSTYKKDIQNLYQASVKDVDFKTQVSQIVEEVNTWVKNKTNGKIDNLLNGLDSSSLLVLLNAIYFKGAWETEFDSRQTRPGDFYNYGMKSEVKQVSMMKLETQLFHMYDPELNARVLEIPYKSGNITMIIMLPVKRGGLEFVEQRITLEKMASIKHEMKRSKIYLTLPKFKIQYSREMSNDFKSLGLNSIFAPGANFSGMTSSPNVFVSHILHKAVIEVNEEGSEAAAASASILSRNHGGFRVNHPFLFCIIDKRNDMILFSGRVTNL